MIAGRYCLEPAQDNLPNTSCPRQPPDPPGRGSGMEWSGPPVSSEGAV